jgi:choline dehydrogenase-like flavoprotein
MPALIRRRDLLRGLGGTAAAGLLGCDLFERRPALRTTPLPEAARRSFDVCIIGSGPAGARLGMLLVERGARTLILESGPRLDEPPADWDPSRLDTYAVTGDADYPLAATRLRAVGGSSHLWTGRCSRLHPEDFEPNAYSPLAGGWPLRYADLAPHYGRAEQALRVAGAPLSDQEAPRAEAPPAEPADSHLQRMRTELAALEVTIDPSPTSQGRYGSGPIRVARDWLPAFTSHALGTLVSGATVTDLRVDAGGVVGRAAVRSLEGSEASVAADRFVVAGGAVESARLLLLSTGHGHPDGLGNRSGQLGAGFMEHPNLTLRGTRPSEIEHATGRSDQLYDAFKHQGLGSILLVFALSPGERHNLRMGATIEMISRSANRVLLAPDLADRFGSPGAALHLAFSLEDRKTLDATRTLLRGYFDRLGVEDVRDDGISWSHHHLGGCRMAAEAGDGVVDPDLRIHGTRNAFVLGSAVFPTGGAAHPTVAIVALAERLADHLVGRRSDSPFT